ncbi:MAG: ATP phosphoribosyltransferase regulatory subunit, partial [Caldilineaceae bacterium]|nr:ATP phosphoribosyltransferase regulatory subunit [Caldilineaceae bacterium]
VEAEVLAAGAQVMEALGFGSKEHPFRLRLNHRGILRGLMEVSGIPPEKEGEALVAIDKLDKIGMDGVRKELAGRGIVDSAAEKLLATMAAAPGDSTETMAWLSDLLEASELGSKGVNDLKSVVGYAAYGPAAPYLHIDPYLARGLSYYTGAIYEIEFPGFSGSGGGGGRYDELVGMFSGQQIPACGFSLGLERILLLMEEQNLFPAKLAGQPQLLVTQFDESTVGVSLTLAQRLRAVGLRVDLYPDNDRYGRQFKYAEERHIRYALLVSPREIENAVIAVKDLVSGDQIDVPNQEIEAWLAENLTG